MSRPSLETHPVVPLNEKLFKACAKGSLEEVRALLDQGADPNYPHLDPPWEDDLPASIYTEDSYCVHEAAENPDIRVFDLLVERGANPNQFDYWARQPLAFAGGSNSLEMVRHLVELGNDPGNIDHDGGTVLTYSALNPDVRVLEFLLSKGAALDDCDMFNTELTIAVRKGTPDRVKFFIDHGSQINISFEWCKEAPLENLRVLLAAGYDPTKAIDVGRADEVEQVKADIAAFDPERKALFAEFGWTGD